MIFVKADDFEYDGLTLSSMGFIISSFDSSGLETISNGSQATFNTIPIQRGAKFELTSVTYDSCIETTFQICKDPCKNDEMEISLEELRYLARWLSREEYRPFRFMDEEEYINIFYEAKFDLSKIEIGGALYGLELNMQTNSPFAKKTKRVITLNFTTENEGKVFYDTSDREGYIYPQTEITVNADGDLSIHNGIEDRTMFIGGCKNGEVITLNYPLITSTLETDATRKLANNFNWNFFRIANDFRNSKNEITASIPCTMKLTYSPIAKVGI